MMERPTPITIKECSEGPLTMEVHPSGYVHIEDDAKNSILILPEEITAVMEYLEKSKIYFQHMGWLK